MTHNPTTSAFELVEQTILEPADLQETQLRSILDELMGQSIDAADAYFQVTRQESWVLEDGIVKEGSHNLEQGVGVRAMCGEKTGFAYSDEIQLNALLAASKSAKAIARGGQQASVQAWRRTEAPALSWQDKIAKKLALWLFAYRFVGVIVLSFTSAEWTILLFPDLFGFFFIFYILYVQFSGSKQLFKNWRSTIPVMIAIFLPKMIQEFSLHIVLPYADKLPEWAVKINDMPYSLLTTPLFIAPFVLIAVYTYRVRRASSKTRSPITPA